MSRKLYNSLKAQKNQTEQVKLTIYGSLGIPLGGRKVIQVDGRQGYVYVRLRDNQNEVIQAFNNKVAASYDLPVILVREGGRYVVQQFNSQRYLNNSQNSAPFLPGHGTQHSFPRGGGADITWVYGQQIIPGLVYPESATGTNVMIEKYPLYSSSGWIYAGGTGTQNILQYRPTTGSSSLMTLVYLDSITGNPGILVGSGTYFPAIITGSVYPYLPSPSNTQIPLAGVLLNTGTTVITWENIYDVRQWVHATPSGTSSGGGGGGVDTIGFAGLSNGVPIGTGTFLNIQGATFTRSGTMFNLNIPASAVYDNFWNSGTAGAYSIRTKNNTTTNALGDYAVAEGQDTTAQASYSHSEGRRTSAIGTGSHAEGYLTTAYGNHSHAEGYQTFVSGTTSFVSGDGNHNIGNQSAILGGLNNRLTGDRSVLLGGFSRTGTASDTVYVPKLNIQTVQAGSPLTLLGVDNQGMVVSGTFPPEQIGVYGLYNGAGLGTGTSLNVVGEGHSLSISGTTLTLNITGTYAIEAGTWTPTGFSGTNVAAITPGVMNYIRVGNQVMFNGLVQVDPVAVGAFTCYLSLPIPSDFTGVNDASGNGTQPGTGVPNIISIREDATNNRLQLDGYNQVTTNTFYRLAGGYIIK